MLIAYRRLTLVIVSSIAVAAVVLARSGPRSTSPSGAPSLASQVVRDLPETTAMDTPGVPWRDAERCPEGYTDVRSEAHWSTGQCRVGPLTFERSSSYGASRWTAGAFECGSGTPDIPEHLRTRFEHREHRALGVHEYRCVRGSDGHVERYRRVGVRPR